MSVVKDAAPCGCTVTAVTNAMSTWPVGTSSNALSANRRAANSFIRTPACASAARISRRVAPPKSSARSARVGTATSVFDDDEEALAGDDGVEADAREVTNGLLEGPLRVAVEDGGGFALDGLAVLSGDLRGVE